MRCYLRHPEKEQRIREALAVKEYIDKYKPKWLSVMSLVENRDYRSRVKSILKKDILKMSSDAWGYERNPSLYFIVPEVET